MQWKIKKNSRDSPKMLTYKFIIFYSFFTYTNFGLYKSYPLNRNLVLEICKERDTEGLVCNSTFSL
jgi:hypothetical protein